MRRLASLLVIVAATMALASSTSGETSKPLTPFEVQKVERRLQNELSCLGCHSLAGEKARVAPELSTVRERRSPAYIAAMLADPSRTVPGTMMPRPMMSEPARELLVRYLSTRPGNAPDIALPPSDAGAGAGADGGAGAPADGAALYTRWCSTCHGTAGRGDGINSAALPVRPANHADARAMSMRPDDSLFDTIAAGGAVMNRSPRMPAFGATLSPVEIRAVVAHLRKLCSCEGPAWSRAGGAP